MYAQWHCKTQKANICYETAIAEFMEERDDRCAQPSYTHAYVDLAAHNDNDIVMIHLICVLTRHQAHTLPIIMNHNDTREYSPCISLRSPEWRSVVSARCDGLR